AVGVGCVSCHGRVDQMEVVRVSEPLGMGWCLECHRNPEPNLRPLDQVTNMEWTPDEHYVASIEVNPPQHCSGCHR
ncbi:MAG: cytochrome C, partial [Myxococcota bacterium]